MRKPYLQNVSETARYPLFLVCPPCPPCPPCTRSHPTSLRPASPRLALSFDYFLDRFHPPSLTPPNSLLGSYTALGEPGDPSATSPLVEHALQGPGRTQRRRGSSFTDSVVAGFGVQVSSSSGSISGGGAIPPPLQLTSTSGLGAVAAYAASNPPLSSSASSSSPSSSLSSRPGPGALPAPRPQRLAPQVLPALDQPPLQAPRPQRPLSLGPRGQGLGQGQGQGQGLPPRPGQAYLRLSPEPGASDS